MVCCVGPVQQRKLVIKIMDEMKLMVVFSLLGGVSDNSTCCHISINKTFRLIQPKEIMEDKISLFVFGKRCS